MLVTALLLVEMVSIILVRVAIWVAVITEPPTKAVLQPALLLQDTDVNGVLIPFQLHRL